MANETQKATQTRTVEGGSLLDDILSETRLKPNDEGYDVAKRGVQAFIQEKLESAWRSLRFVVDKVDFRENIKLELLSVAKDDLLQDLEDSPDITKSGFYTIAYSNEYGVFGGKPFGVMNFNYDFGPGAQDVELLRKVSAVAAMSHCPV